MLKKTRKKRGGSSCSTMKNGSAALCKEISKLDDNARKQIKDFIQAITLTLDDETDKKSFGDAIEVFNKSIEAIKKVMDERNNTFNEEFKKDFPDIKDDSKTIELTINLLTKRKENQALKGESLKEFDSLIQRLRGLSEEMGKPHINSSKSTANKPKGMLGTVKNKIMGAFKPAFPVLPKGVANSSSVNPAKVAAAQKEKERKDKEEAEEIRKLESQSKPSGFGLGSLKP